MIASVARSDKAKEASLSRKVEKELQKQHEYVCGVDEAGRGEHSVACMCICVYAYTYGTEIAMNE